MCSACVEAGVAGESSFECLLAVSLIEPGFSFNDVDSADRPNRRLLVTLVSA